MITILYKFITIIILLYMCLNWDSQNFHETDPDNIVLLAFVFYLGFLFLLRGKKEKKKTPRSYTLHWTYVSLLL